MRWFKLLAIASKQILSSSYLSPEIVKVSSFICYETYADKSGNRNLRSRCSRL